MDETAAATKGDIQWLHKEMQRMFKSLYETDDQILTILTNVDRRLTEQGKDHDRRLRKLEVRAT